MTLENDFLTWAASATGTDLATQSAYAGYSYLSGGFDPNVQLRNDIYNKSIRQATFMASSVGLFLNANGFNAFDDANGGELSGNIEAAINHSASAFMTNPITGRQFGFGAANLADCNAATLGLALWQPSTANAPSTGTYGLIDTFSDQGNATPGSSNFIFQKAFEYITAIEYHREYYPATGWTAWQQLTTLAQLTAAIASINNGRLLAVQTFDPTGGGSGTYTPAPGTVFSIKRLVGGGGGGSNCEASSVSGDVSGAGGGAGGYLEYYDSSPVAASYTVGAPGGPQSNGGSTTLGQLTAGGGFGASFSGTGICLGGIGGTWSIGTAVSSGIIASSHGNAGNNGQTLQIMGFGNGGAGIWGGAGLAGTGTGGSATGYGAGGGGVLDPQLSGNAYVGGYGYQGIITVYDFS